MVRPGRGTAPDQGDPDPPDRSPGGRARYLTQPGSICSPLSSRGAPFPDDRARGRAALPCIRHLLAPPARCRPNPRASDRCRSARIAPVRPLEVAGGTMTWCCSRGSTAIDGRGRTRGLYEERGCSRRTTRDCRSLPTKELPCYRVSWDRIAADRPAIRGARGSSWPNSWSGSGRAGRWRRETSRLARRSTGTGGRRTRSEPSSRLSPRQGCWGSPGATATVASTTSRSGSSLPSCWAIAPGRPGNSSVTGSCPAIAPTVCSGAAVRPRSGWGSAGAAADENDPEWAPGQPCAPNSRRTGASSPCRSRASGAIASSSRTSSRCWTLPGARSRPASGRAERHPGSRSSPRLTRSRGTASSFGHCFGFDYIWEVYVPAAKRRWGYYVLPILFGDRLVGRIEPRIDRKADTLRILGVWWEDGFEPLKAEGFVDAFVEAIDAHRAFGDVKRHAWPRTAKLRALGVEVKRRLA